MERVRVIDPGDPRKTIEHEVLAGTIIEEIDSGYVLARWYGSEIHVDYIHIGSRARREGRASELYDRLMDLGASRLTAFVEQENTPAVAFHDTYRSSRFGGERFTGGSWSCPQRF